MKELITKLRQELFAKPSPGEVLAPLFWEFNLAGLNLYQYSDFVVARVIEKGRVEHIKILFTIYPKAEVFKSITNNPDISSAKKNFWNSIQKHV